MTKHDFIQWVKRRNPDQEFYTMQLSADEKFVMVTRERTSNSRILMDRLRHGVTASMQRQLRKTTTASVPGRHFHRCPAPELQPIVPSANDPKAIFDSDPLFIAGEYWNLVPAGQRRQSGLRIANWIRGHIWHCVQCAAFNTSQDYDLADYNDEEIVSGFRKWYHPNCYGARLAGYLIYGFLPHFLKPVQPYETKIYSSLYRYRGMRAAWKKQTSMPGLFAPAPSSPYVNSLTGSEKFSEVQEAKANNGVPKCRVCLDIRYPNEAMADWPVRYEDVDAITVSVLPGDFFVKQDLSSFYLRLPTHSAFNPYQTFRDPITKEKKMYLFLSFGVKVGSTYASGVSAEANLIIRAELIRQSLTTRFTVYIDDYFGKSQAKDDAQAALDTSDVVLNEFLGLPTSSDKKVLPTQRCEMLGVVLDSCSCTSSVKQKHRRYAVRELTRIIETKTVTAQRLHRLCGLLNFFVPLVFGSRPFLRPLWLLLKAKKRNNRVKISNSQYNKINWWLRLLQKGIPAPDTPWVNPAVSPVKSFSSDASGSIGCGLWIGKQRYFHKWNSDERSASIGAKELWPVLRCLERFETEFVNSVLIAFTDNVGNVYAVNAGSTRSPDEAAMLERMAVIQRRGNIRLLASWLPREFNPIADMISKLEIDGEQF